MAHGGVARNELSTPSGDEPRLVGILAATVRTINATIMFIGGLALVAASLVLTHSVVVRYVLKSATDWQDEMAVFLIIGATFMSAAAVQERRGHVAIEAFTSLAGPRLTAVRRFLVDVLSLVFSSYLSWKCAELLLEAVHDNQRTESSWAPPLWIPYGLMTTGLALLALQILLQITRSLFTRSSKS